MKLRKALNVGMHYP